MKNKQKKYNYKKDFLDNGVMSIRNQLDQSKCKILYNNIFNYYNWGKNIFRSKKDFLSNPTFIKTNPGRYKNNLALKYDLSFVEKNKYFKKILFDILGTKYEIILKKFVVAVPETWVPKWLKRKVKKQLIPNLGNYLLPKFRECSYFRGIDYHMDLLDQKNDSSKYKYITLYVYLNQVSKKMSPINILEKSHESGVQKFPHNIKKYTASKIKMDNKRILKNRLLVGNPGDFFVWSCFNLHGTKPNLHNEPRISIRYTIRKKNESKSKTLINQLYKRIKGNLSLEEIRDDIDEKTFEQKKFKKILL